MPPPALFSFPPPPVPILTSKPSQEVTVILIREGGQYILDVLTELRREEEQGQCQSGEH